MSEVASQRSPREPINLYLIDDHTMVRELLAGYLGQREGFAVVGATGSAEEAIAEVGHLRPHVVLLDYRLAGEDGIAACPKILEAAPGACVVVLTMHRGTELAERALKAGAKGFVTKGNDIEALEHAIRAVAGGARFIDSDLAAHYKLTQHELAALALVAAGRRTPQIAAALRLSRNTVDTYLRRGAKKLGAHTRAEATAIIIREGLV